MCIMLLHFYVLSKFCSCCCECHKNTFKMTPCFINIFLDEKYLQKVCLVFFWQKPPTKILR